jgi:hypothetical protein
MRNFSNDIQNFVKPDFESEISQYSKHILPAIDQKLKSKLQNNIFGKSLNINRSYISDDEFNFAKNLVDCLSSTRADRENPNNISIISSYGSQCVQIPQQKFDLSLIELKKFVEDLELHRSSDPTALQKVSQFIDRYFLQDGLITRKVEKDEGTERKKFETIKPESGKRRELIENILPKRYRVFIYPSYSNIVSEIIQYTSTYSSGGKRTNKRRVGRCGIKSQRVSISFRFKH